MSYRRQALIFVILVLVISWSFQVFIILNGGVKDFGPQWIAALMCIPGAVSVMIRLFMKSGFKDAGLRIGSGRYYVYALGAPFILAALVGILSVVLDIRRISLISTEEFGQLTPTLLFVLALGLIGAFGEELGWRGFLLPKLISGKIKHSYLIVGLIWAFWHVPIIALGEFYQTDNRLLMVTVYCFGIAAMSYFFSELRMKSGSVWVTTIVHAAHNFLFQFIIPALLLRSSGSRKELWDFVASDTGLTIAILYIAAYIILRRMRSHLQI